MNTRLEDRLWKVVLLAALTLAGFLLRLTLDDMREALRRGQQIDERLTEALSKIDTRLTLVEDRSLRNEADIRGATGK